MVLCHTLVEFKEVGSPRVLPGQSTLLLIHFFWSFLEQDLSKSSSIIYQICQSNSYFENIWLWRSIYLFFKIPDIWCSLLHLLLQENCSLWLTGKMDFGISTNGWASYPILGDLLDIFLPYFLSLSFIKCLLLSW